MGKKKSTGTENVGSGKLKATWLDEVVAIFCDIAAKEVAKGNRPGTHFDKKGWSNVIMAFKELTGRDYDKSQLKNKWDSLKNDWKLWSSLLHKETGIGWDPARKTVDAPTEWWESKIQVNYVLQLYCGGMLHWLHALLLINPEYRKFQDVGISPEMMAVYDNMFRGSTALGHFVMIPSATINIEEVVEDSKHNLIFGDDEEDSDQDNERRGKKRTNLEGQTEADKEKN
ncbi:L10-interacting MYB domain-containing protein-like [Rosa chinensis]|uniref:L10-interacting MYB domain-containing protein-like n=1 Tax=Rosa chinensis TaxID=74649 RepID=UPI000D0896C6|nr:L10-interacting MYB domain-containing protein-like [Rosa chinensis]